jgi:glutathione S-transferase
MFAALNSVEPQIMNLAAIDLANRDQEWAKQRRPAVETAVTKRLTDLSAWLDDRDYLEGRFTAGDLLMTSVLRILRHTELLAGFPVLDTYKKRCEARPAFQKALADHMTLFAAGPPAKA